jgi:hypothetical protein
MPRQRLNKEYIDTLVTRLWQLHGATDPDNNAPAVGKDRRAAQAIGGAQALAVELAGWAYAHVAGRVWNGCDYAKPAVVGHGLDELYRSAAEKADDHRHEATEITADPSENSKARRVLAALLPYMPGLPRALDLAEGLEGLNFGEALPLVTPVKDGKHASHYTLAKLKLRALCHVAFQCGQGVKKYIAIECVADAYGCGADTVENWERRDLPETLGVMRVRDAMNYASAGGEQFKAYQNGKTDLNGTAPPAYAEEIMADLLREYGPEALKQDATKYMAALRAAKAAKAASRRRQSR